MIRSTSAVISALFACGIVGGLYGALLGAIDMGLVYAHLGFGTAHLQDFFDFMAGSAVFGAMVGFPAGFIAGVLGAGLGGPIGYGVSGLAASGAVTLLCFGSGEALQAWPVVVQPWIWGSAFGLVFGLHIKRRLRVLPGLGWLSDIVYGSPLGRWLGWRQRRIG